MANPNDMPGPAPRTPAQRITAQRDVIASLAVRAGAVVASFCITYLIGSRLGAAATGQYALISQTAQFFAIVGLLGLQVSVVRHFAKAVADNARLAIGTVLKVFGVGAGLMLAIALSLWFGGDLVWRSLFGDTVPREMLLVLCLMLLGRGGVQLLDGMLRSQHNFILGQTILALTIPGTTALALAVGWVETVHGALWVAALTGLASVALGAAAMARYVRPAPRGMHIPLSSLIASSLPLWGVAIAQSISDWYSLAIAARVLSAADAGLFRVSVQIVMVLQVASLALFSVYSAKISAAFHARDRTAAARLARSAVRIGSAIAIPGTIVLLLVGEIVLAQFGPEFLAAYPVMVALLLGQLAFTLTGPCGLVLAMSGNERINLAITIGYTFVVLIATPLAALAGGLMGIAIAMSVAQLLRNGVSYAIVLRQEGIDIWSGTARIIAQ